MYLGDYYPNIEKKFYKFKFSGISFNSKTIKKGNIFFAVKGNKFDGNKFINIAINNGAKIIISETCKEKIENNILYLTESVNKVIFNNPKIIIADQPENYLDEVIKKKLFFLLESLNKLGATIIMTSNNHNMLTSTYKIINLGDGKW